MADEIDRLEIAVEAEANNANRALGTMEKKLNRIADSLEKVMIMAQGGFSFKGVDVGKLFSGDAMKSSARKAGKDLSDNLIKGFNLDKADADIQKQVKTLTGKISKGLAGASGHPYSGMDKDIEKLGSLVAKNGSVAKSTMDDYQKLYETIKSLGRIKISPETAKSLGDSYKERSGLLKQKMNTSSGTELDSIYQELKGQFPSILKEANNVEEEFYQINDALKKFYDLSNSFEKPAWLEDAAYESVVDGVESMSKSILEAKDKATELSESMHGIADTGKSFSELFGAGMDTSGLEKATSLFREMSKGSSSGKRENRSDLKYQNQSLDDLYEKHSQAGNNLDVSGMTFPELQKGLKNAESEAQRLNDRLEKKMAVEGVESLGKSFESLVYDIQKATNQAEIFRTAIENLSEKKVPEFTIERDGETYSSTAESSPSFKEDVADVSAESEQAKTAVENLNDSISEVGSDTSNIDKANSKFNSLCSKANEIFRTLTKDGLKGIPSNFAQGILNATKLPSTRSAEEQIKFDTDTSEIDSVIERINEEIERVKFNIKDAFASGDSAKIDGVQESILDLKQLEKELKTYEQIKGSVYSNNDMPTIKSAFSGMKEIVGNSMPAPVKIIGSGVSASFKVLKTAASVAFKAISFGAKGAVNVIKRIPSVVSKIGSAFKKVGSAAKGVFNTASKLAHPFKTLKGLMGGKQNNSGMNMGRMIGSSIAFSAVSGAISKIKSAVKEGSDNLVQYSSSYNNSISGMVTSLLYLKNAFAVAFAPIVNVVAPYISKFIDMIAGALNAVGQFTAALTGKGHTVQAKKSWYDYGKSLEDTGKKANDTKKKLKDLKTNTLGIDQLNVLQPNTDDSSGNDSSGSSGKYTGPSPSEMFETVSVSDSANKWADMFKKAWEDADFTEIGTIVGTKLKNALDNIPWDGIQETAQKIGKSVGTFITGFVEVPNLGWKIGSTVGEGINTGIDLANSFLDNTKWESVGVFIGDGLNGVVNTIDWQGLGHMFAEKSNAIFATIGEAARTFQWGDFGKNLADSINQWITDFNWAENGARLGDLAIGLLDTFAQFLENVNWQELGDKCAEFVGNVDWNGVITKIAERLGAAAGASVGFIWGVLRDELVKVVDYWKDAAFEDGQFTFQGVLDGIIDGVKNIGSWIKENIFDPFIDGFKSAFGIHSPSTVMAEQGGYIMSGLLNGVTKKLQEILDFFGGLKDSIVEKFTDIKDKLGEKFNSARKTIEDKFSDIGKWFSERKDDIQDSLKDVGSWIGDKFSSGRKKVNSAFQDIGTWFGKRKSNIQDNMKSISTWFSDTFKKAYKGITSVFDKIGTYFEKVAGWIESPVKGALNGVRKAVNWIYEKLGGKKDLIPKFATGTSGVSKDTFGVVNDQSGSTYREMVQFPNGKTIIPTGRNVVLPMPKGTKVLPANKTAALMQQSMPHFKNGIGDFFGGAWSKIKDFTGNVLDYVENPKKLVQMGIDNFTDLTGAIEPGLSLAKGAVSTVFDKAVSKVKSFLSELGSSSVNYTPSAGVEQWRSIAKKALEMTGQFSEANLNRLLMQMKSESGGNPRAINNWDINAKKGIPSKGLMQVIDPTFKSYALAPYNKDIYDPMSNILAAIRYTLARYGSLERGWKGHGYANGGFPKVGEMFYANESGPELVGKIGNRTAVVNQPQIIESVSSGVERANNETNNLLRTVIEYQKLLLQKETSVNIDGKRADKQISKARRNTGFSFSPT